MKKNLLILCPVLIGSICMALVRKNFNVTVTRPVQKTEVSAAIGCAPLANENIYADNDGRLKDHWISAQQKSLNVNSNFKLA